MTREELEMLRNKPGKYVVKDIATQKPVRIHTWSATRQIFEYKKGSKRYGRYLSEEEALARFALTSAIKDPTETWHRQLKRAISMLEESGLHDRIKVMYQNLLTMTYEDHQSLCHVWNQELCRQPAPDKARLCQLYPFAFDPSDNTVESEYISELSDCIIKSMYFGKYGHLYKEDVRRALRNKEKTHFTFDNGRYDGYFSYDPNGSAVYAQEYRGTGNGHYYLVLDDSHCVFYEDD